MAFCLQVRCCCTRLQEHSRVSRAAGIGRRVCAHVCIVKQDGARVQQGSCACTHCAFDAVAFCLQGSTVWQEGLRSMRRACVMMQVHSSLAGWCQGAAVRLQLRTRCGSDKQQLTCYFSNSNLAGSAGADGGAVA
jgi:hypothetical protein